MSEMTRVGALSAVKAGGEAFRAGKTVADCPHSPNGDLADRFLAHHWVRGFTIAGDDA